MTLLACSMVGAVWALEPVKLNKPNLERGKSLMKTLSERHSVRDYADKALSLQDLSDLLWAANGINRDDGRRTAPSAMNKQPIRLYVVDSRGTWYYNHKTHTLEPIKEGDFRQKMRGSTPALNLLVVSESPGTSYSGVDAGYVSQNICLVCTALDLATVPAGTMDHDAFAKACNLDTKHKIFIQHPVGYPKK